MPRQTATGERGDPLRAVPTAARTSPFAFGDYRQTGIEPNERKSNGQTEQMDRAVG
jgi:hypothetical protein